ncbi:MAG: response regulator [Candidatus Aerophobetes bacterium]|nr:response regulator [Candidatus Aerophobetes bacterium]
MKILVVDDERDMCWLLSRVFQDAGYKVIIAVNGEEALTKVEKEEPDLVILDVKLPVISGMEVLSTIKKVKPGIVIIMISAYGTEEIRKEAMRIGAYDFIDKPFSIERIRQTVRKASLGISS